MIKSVLHLFKIHRKVILGNTSIIVQDMFGKTPKSFDAVDMILGSFVDHSLRVVYRMVLPESLQRIVASEGVRIIDRSFSCFLSNDRHKFIFGHMLHNPRIDPSVALQKPKYDAFPSRPSSALSLSSAAEVGFVKFNLTREFLSLKFGNVVDRFTKVLVDSRDRLIVDTEIVGETVRRLLLIETLDNCNFFLQLFQRLLFSTGFVSAPHIAATGFRDSKGSTKNTLLSLQKVGCATENVLLSCNHKDILDPLGYFCH